jgi:PAS domain S-box-containing protein
MKRGGPSIRHKVAGAIFGAIACSLLFCAVGLGLYEYQAADNRLRSGLTTLRDTLLPAVASAVEFEVPEAAGEVLARLEEVAIVKAARVYRPDTGEGGAPFAVFRRQGEEGPATPGAFQDGFSVAGGTGVLVSTFVRDGRPVAVLVLEGNLAATRRGVSDSLQILAALFVLLLGLGAVVAHLIGRSIVEPVLALAETARDVQETGDFGRRAPVLGDDELGRLAQRFNAMLDGLAERDRRLFEAGAFNGAILESSGIAIISTDPRGIVRTFNPAAEALLGYPEAEIVGRVDPSVWHEPVEVAALAGELAATLGRQVEVGFATFALSAESFPGEGREWTYIRKDGTCVSVYLVISALRDAEGRLIGYCGLATDLSERKAAEAALRASEQRYRLVIDQTNQMVYELDVASGVNRWFGADAVARITGYTLEEFQQVTLDGWADLIHPDDRSATLQEFDRCLAASARFDAVYRFRHKDGSYRVIHDFGVFLRDGRGRVDRMLGAMADVTERHEAEAAIRRLNAELEHRVEERTAELARRVAEVERLNAEQAALMRSLRMSEQAADRSAARLQEANASLYAANQVLEAFSYSVSHDLRAPLRNISGFLDLLSRRPSAGADPEAARHLTVIGNEVERMGLLIDDLLTFARLGRTEMKREAVALEQVFAEARASMEQDLAGRSVEWRTGPLPAVRGDRGLLRQVALNLLSNAVKFTRKRPQARIEIEAGPVRPEDKFATFCVRDNGAGFNPKYLGKLFGVFQRLHNSRDYEGTGIGLANVKRIVVRHGGRVWAEGDVDKGASFYFTLPLDQMDAGEPKQNGAP